MSTTDAMRKVFDECTVMAGVEPDFECVYITKDAALLYLNEIDAESAKLRELVRDMYKAFVHGNCYRWCEFKEPCNYISDGKCQWYDRMRELGVEVVE